MTIIRVPTQPIAGQKPGTSGLRKKTRVFQQPGYLENFVQSIWNGIGGIAGKTLVLGGDGRFLNDVAIQTILRMAAASGAGRMIVGQHGFLSTPAASHLIRKRGTDGGLILSASHNPGGPDEDFGIKYNMMNGGPASESVTDAIYAQTVSVIEYLTFESTDLDLTKLGQTKLGDMVVEVVDPVSDYADLMENLFCFKSIRVLLQSGCELIFDAMHAITGPYAVEILENRLGAAPGSVTHSSPLPDFGGGHPDPNPVWAKPLYDAAMGANGPDFSAASDGDGDRNMIVGRGAYVSPSDSLAVLAANLHLCPGYAGGITGVARSMPISQAVDRVAAARGLRCFATPTGWKFFGNLLDAGLIELCGEESFGTGSNHVREKDGIWAVLAWLNILAATGKSVAQILTDHWAEFGRTWYSRHDYEALDTPTAEALMADLRAALPDLPGRDAGSLTVTSAEDFAYTDPVDGSVSTGQGVQITFTGGARAVLRLSGTGTEGATLRLYLERQDGAAADSEVQIALAPVATAIEALTGLAARTGRTAPDVIT